MKAQQLPFSPPNHQSVAVQTEGRINILQQREKKNSFEKEEA